MIFDYTLLLCVPLYVSLTFLTECTVLTFGIFRLFNPGLQLSSAVLSYISVANLNLTSLKVKTLARHDLSEKWRILSSKHKWGLAFIQKIKSVDTPHDPYNPWDCQKIIQCFLTNFDKNDQYVIVFDAFKHSTSISSSLAPLHTVLHHLIVSPNISQIMETLKFKPNPTQVVLNVSDII